MDLRSAKWFYGIYSIPLLIIILSLFAISSIISSFILGAVMTFFKFTLLAGWIKKFLRFLLCLGFFIFRTTCCLLDKWALRFFGYIWHFVHDRGTHFQGNWFKLSFPMQLIQALVEKSFPNNAALVCFNEVVMNDPTQSCSN